MKVMHLIGGGDVGGAKTHVLSLVAHLCSEAEALLVSLRAGEFADDAKAFGIPTTVVRTGNPVKDIMTLKNLVLSGKFDIVHCHGSKANVMGAILARLCKCPVITTVHSDYRLDYMGSPIKQYTFGVLNTMALRLLDGYISVTGTFQDMLIERGFDPYHVYPIYNGLDFTAQLAPQMSRVDYLNSIGLTSDDDTVVFGIAARLHPVKDIGTIVRAFAKTVKSCPNMRLVIGGDGEQMEYLSGLVREFKLDEYVAMPGWITDMDTFLEAIDVNLLSSLSESFPYSVLEAVRAGCTMVCSSVGGMPILIDHGANGLLFTPQDVDKLGEHMSYLYNNPDERREMAEKLLEKARKLYSIDKMVSDQLEIYRTVLRDYESEKKKRAMITICGSYGRGNAGDDAILSALKGEFSEIEKDVRICVMSRNPKSTKKIYHIRSVFTFNIFKMAGSMLKSHLYVNGGGSLIQDSTSSRSLYFYLFTLIAARILGCDVMMYGCGIGPVRGKTNRRIAAWVINHTATSITLRDPGSGEELTRMGVIRPQITLAADPTLNLAPASDEVVKSAFFSEGLTMDGEHICFAMRNWKGFEEKINDIARVADEVSYEYGLKVVLMPMERERDLPIAEAIADAMSCDAVVMRGRYNVNAVIGMLARMRLIVAMRLHALVFGAGQGVPVIGISYDDKVSRFMDYIGRELCIAYDECNYEKLKSYIDIALRDEAISQKLRESTKLIRENERANVRAAKEFFK